MSEPIAKVSATRAVAAEEASDDRFASDYGKKHPRDWPEDFRHENGCYMNRCHACSETFIGYKRRVVLQILHTTLLEQRVRDSLYISLFNSWLQKFEA